MHTSIYIPIFLLFGVVVTYFGISDQIKSTSLKESGIVVQSLDTKGNTDVIRNGTHTIREIAPQFKTNKGEVVSCRAKINDDMQTALLQNPIVEIRYLADNPKVCEVIGSDPKNNKIPLIVGIITICGSLFFGLNAKIKNQDGL